MLSILRVILAINVFLQHSNTDKVFLNHINYKSLRYGDMSVLGFFIISGYLINHIMKTKFYDKPFWKFLLLRYLRIYPLFLTVFLCIYIIIRMQFGLFKTIEFMTLIIPGIKQVFDIFDIQNALNLFWKSYPQAFPQTWTLSFDVLFYPLGYIFYKNKYLLGVMSFISLCVITFVSFMYPNKWSSTTYITFAPTLLSFCFGFMIYEINDITQKFNKKLFIIGLLILIYTIYLPFFINPYIQSLLDIFGFMLVVPELAKIQTSYEKILADITFAFYLIHYEVLFLIYDGNPYDRYNVMDNVISFITSIILGLLFGILIENMLFEKLRKRFEQILLK